MSKSKILIADDNPTNVELLEVYLSDYDCEVAIAVDGRDTLDKVAEFQPDLNVDAEPMLNRLTEILTSISDPGIRLLMEAFLADQSIVRGLSQAPEKTLT